MLEIYKLMIQNLESLNRQEIEELIVDLYYNQKKTFNQIRKIVRKSPRDIKAILDRAEPGRTTIPVPTQAYTLYSEGKNPLEVAVTLNLREPEATQYYREYWTLKQLGHLDQVCKETRGNFSSLLDLYRQTKSAGMGVADIIVLLKVANNDLPSFEKRWQEYRREEDSLRKSIENASRILRELNDQISAENMTLNRIELLEKKYRQEINRLIQSKMGLENCVAHIQEKETYTKIRNAIKFDIEQVVTNPKLIMALALVSLIETSKVDPHGFYALCYNKGTVSIPRTWVSTSTNSDGQYTDEASMNEKLLHPDYTDSDDSFESLLLSEAVKLYNKLVDDSVLRSVYLVPDKKALGLTR